MEKKTVRTHEEFDSMQLNTVQQTLMLQSKREIASRK